jgi:hypothetical protein
MPEKTSPRLKLEWAQKHILELEKILADFWASYPYSIFPEDHTEGGEQVRSWFLFNLKPVPFTVPLLAGDALQNMRSSLDHLIHQAIFKSSGSWPTKKIIGFPIGKNATEYRAPDFGGKVEGLRQEGKDILERMKPYHGGNEAFWRLHSLNNIDKHRVLITAYNSLTARKGTQRDRDRILRIYRGSYPDATVMPDLTNISVQANDVDFPLQEGSKLATLPISELEKEMSFSFDISFNEPGVVREPVAAVLRTSETMVEAAIGQFETAGLI